MATTTILSIDGGGMRGLIPATFLMQLETRTRRPVASLFDYVAGTSTGGILALGFTRSDPAAEVQPLKASELVALYQNEGGHIFSRSLWHTITSVGSLNGPKYPPDGPDGVLKKYFGQARLKDCLTTRCSARILLFPKGLAGPRGSIPSPHIASDEGGSPSCRRSASTRECLDLRGVLATMSTNVEKPSYMYGASLVPASSDLTASALLLLFSINFSPLR